MNVPDALRIAHKELQRAVLPARRKAKATEGKLAASFAEAMRFWDRMKADGGTLADLTKGLAAVLKDAWPMGECGCPRCRFQCFYCEDTGAKWEQRPARIYGGKPTGIVVPCSCDRGGRFREKQRGSEDFTAAGRSKSPTRVGR